MRNEGMFGGIYGLAFIGAAVYFIQHATSFWVGVLGFFKALLWPAVIMYKVLELLQMGGFRRQCLGPSVSLN